MKILFLPLAFFVFLGSCKKDTDIDFEKDFCDNETEIVADSDIGAEFDKKDSFAILFDANCFTPNGDGVNDVFALEFRYERGSVSGAFESFKVYNKKRKLVAETSSWGWDGKNDDGKIVEGEYAYEAIMKLSDERLITVNGHFLSVTGTCIDDCYEIDCLRFPDQLHPRLGAIYDTKEALAICE